MGYDDDMITIALQNNDIYDVTTLTDWICENLDMIEE